MISAKYLFTGLLLTVCSMISRAAPIRLSDTAEIIINISISPSSFVHPSWLDIYKRKRTLKLVYTVQDSIRFRALRANKVDFITIKKYFELTEPTKLQDSLNSYKRAEIFRKIDSLLKKYTVYIIDSVVLKTKSETEYIHLLEKVTKASQAELENDNIHKTMFMLDGTGYNFVIKSGLKNTTVWVRAPSRESNPLLYRLLDVTRRIYESQRPNSLLTKMRF